MLKILAFIIIFLIALWYAALPALVVLSLIPQIPRPPLALLTPAPVVSTVLAGSLAVDRYQIGDHRGRADLIIFPAANEKGKDDERLQRLAQIFARSGLRVWVPTLNNVNREKFHPRVLEEMETVITFVKQQQPKLPLKIMSFSVAVGPELIVAARENIGPNLDLIVAMGGYFDLENVIAFHTTGQGTSSAEATAVKQDPFGIWLLARYYAQFLPPNDARIFYELADRKWQDPSADISDLKTKLGSEGQAALALLLNKDPARVAELIAKLPQELKDFLAVFDPEPHLSRLQAPILLLHSQQDRIIPFEESEKLFAALRQQNKKAQILELRVFDHVNPILPKPTLNNLFTLYLPEFWRLYQAAWKIIY